MAKVGAKGQVVINKEIRDRLGVEPGWIAVQRVVGDHVEIRFLPPKHRRSLKGLLSPYVDRSLADSESWDRARETAWKDAVSNRPGERDAE
jgi:AbrB family looped-hinge helix DNA binding protein